jgi:hypothetical protein
MKVIVEKGIGKVTIIKEHGDPIFRYSGWSNPESCFLHRVKKELLKQGFDCIKKRMWRDGYMVGDTVQYIRDTKHKWCIWNSSYAIYDAGEKFNKEGICVLDYTEIYMEIIK